MLWTKYYYCFAGTLWSGGFYLRPPRLEPPPMLLPRLLPMLPLRLLPMPEPLRLLPMPELRLELMLPMLEAREELRLELMSELCDVLKPEL